MVENQPTLNTIDQINTPPHDHDEPEPEPEPETSHLGQNG